ncbi:MAG: thiamine pyrophosphate-dependent dehydrogenase E1 component subunit alpha [Candidatus Bathyarchaeia archaeon]
MEKEKLIELYESMVRIRFFEEKLIELALKGAVPGYPHLCIGQEASIAGVCVNLRKDDYVTGTHRGHGLNVAKGAKLDRLMAEILGKKTGYNKGKAGTMHASAFEEGVVGCFAVVGDGVPVSAGVGLSIKLKGKDQVVACFFGDGATNTASFHEGMNLAAVWDLPVIFVCENNLYAVTTRITTTTKVKRLSERAIAYGIPGITVDGNDVFAVYEEAKKAVEKARRGEGPTFLECLTYRFRGSSEGDPNRGLTYRSAQELEEWMKRDPVKRFREKVIHDKALTQKELDDIDDKVKKEVEEATKFAYESPYPNPEEALEDLYA